VAFLLVWIFAGWPLSIRIWLPLALVAGVSLASIISLFVSAKLSARLARGAAAGVALVVAIATVLSVGPGAGDAGSGQPAGSPPAPSTSPSPAASTSPSSASSEGQTETASATPRPKITSETMSASPSPTPTPEAIEQTINATTDIAEDSTESSKAQSGPLVVSAMHVIGSGCSGAPGWRVHRRPDQLGEPPDYNDLAALPRWVKQHDGIEVSGTRVEMVLQSKMRSAVAVDYMKIKILDRMKPPSTGTHVISMAECGGGEDNLYLVGKLDTTPTQVYLRELKIIEGAEVVVKKSSRRCSTKIYPITDTEPQRMVLVAYGSKYDYEWELEVGWLAPDGARRVTTIRDEGGKPFRTAVRLSKTAYNANSQSAQRHWVKQTPANGDG
jgi:hypothetical protein